MHRTLAILTVCVCLGIAASRLCRFFLPDIPFVLYFSALVLLIAWRLQETRCGFVVAVCILSLSCGCAHTMVCRHLFTDDIQGILRSAGGRAYAVLDGRIVNEPQLRNGKAGFRVAAKAIRLGPEQLLPCSGIVRVEVKQPQESIFDPGQLGQGQLLRLSGTLRLDWPMPIMRLVSPSQLALIDRRLSLPGRACRIKNSLCSVLRGRLSATGAAVAAAMVLGEKKDLSPILYNRMIMTGTVHILVVSGFNVGIICGIVLLFLKVLGLPRLPRFFLASLLVALYCLVCGASTPVVRAGIMAVVCMFSRLVKRQADLLTACAFSALCVLIDDPQQLFSVSFQLSYASVLALIVVFPLIRRLLPALKNRPAAVRFALDSLIVSLSAWLGTAPVIAWHFGMAAPVAVAANIFIPAIAGLITLCGCLLAAVYYVCPYLTSPFASVVETLVAALLRLNSLFLKVPGAVFFFDKARGL